MLKSLVSWDSVMNHRRVQWNHGGARRERLPASAAGRRRSGMCVGEGLSAILLSGITGGEIATLLLFGGLQYESVFYGAVKVLTCLD